VADDADDQVKAALTEIFHPDEPDPEFDVDNLLNRAMTAAGVPETWTVDECAAEWSIVPSTWRSYVRAGRAPQPLLGYDEKRRRLWDAEAVRNWPRPGQGARSDLSKKGES